MRAVSCDWSRLTRAEKVASASTNRSAGGAARAVASRIVVLSPDLWPGVDQRCLQSGLHDAGVCASLKKSTRKFDFCVYAIEPHPNHCGTEGCSVSPMRPMPIALQLLRDRQRLGDGVEAGG